MKFFFFIVMLLILFEIYVVCMGEIIYQDNLIICEDFMINFNQFVIYSYNFNDIICLGIYKIMCMDFFDIIVGLYNDIVKLKLKIVWVDNNIFIMLFIMGYMVMVEFVFFGVNVNIFVGSGNSVLINGVVLIISVFFVIQFMVGLWFLGCLLVGRGWNVCVVDYNSYFRGVGLYLFDLFVFYDCKQIICKFEDLMIMLLNIVFFELYNIGKVSNKNVVDNI